MFRKVTFDSILFLPAEGRIGEDDVHAVGLTIADIGPGQGIVVTDEGGVVDAVQQHVRHTEHVRELLFLAGAQGLLHLLFVDRFLHIAVAHVANGTGEKPAGAAGRIEKNFPWARVNAVRHEGRDGARRIVFARIAGALEIIQDLLVDVAEMLALGQVVEVDAIDLIDDLAHELAGLHVVVGVFEDIPHDPPAPALSGAGQFLERGKELVIHKRHQGFAGHAFGVRGPAPPLKLFRMGER